MPSTRTLEDASRPDSMTTSDHLFFRALSRPQDVLNLCDDTHLKPNCAPLARASRRADAAQPVRKALRSRREGADVGTDVDFIDIDGGSAMRFRELVNRAGY